MGNRIIVQLDKSAVEQIMDNLSDEVRLEVASGTMANVIRSYLSKLGEDEKSKIEIQIREKIRSEIGDLTGQELGITEEKVKQWGQTRTRYKVTLSGDKLIAVQEEAARLAKSMFDVELAKIMDNDSRYVQRLRRLVREEVDKKTQEVVDEISEGMKGSISDALKEALGLNERSVG